MKKRLAIAYVASVLLGMLVPLQATLAEGLKAYAESDAAQRMCQVQEAEPLSLAISEAPCAEQPVEALPCTALSGNVERSDVNPVALAAKSDVQVGPIFVACDPPSRTSFERSPETRGAAILSHLHTIVLRV